jgi:hypothetical protein
MNHTAALLTAKNMRKAALTNQTYDVLPEDERAKEAEEEAAKTQENTFRSR